MGRAMRRILAFAVCGLSLGACTSADLFRLDSSQVTLRLESQPAGAEAKVSSGGTCKTPCAVPVNSTVGELTVAYTLEGYQPLEVAVQILAPLDPREGPALVNPNPVYVELEALPRPAIRRPAKKQPAAKKPAAKKPAAKKPAAKKPAAKKPAATRPAPAPAPAAAPAPAPAPAAPAPAATQPSPWPPAPGQPPAQR